MKENINVFLRSKGVVQRICDDIEILWIKKGEHLFNIKWGEIVLIVIDNIDIPVDANIDPMSEARYNKDSATIIHGFIKEYDRYINELPVIKKDET